MADILKSIMITLDINHEGGYVDNPADSGGPTNFGITQKDMPGVNIQQLQEAQAVGWYYNTKTPEQFNNPLYEQIVFQPLCDKIFDLGVVFGVQGAVKPLQIVLGLQPVDGIFGSATLKAVNSAEPISLCKAYRTGMVTHAIAVATASPKDRVFLQGWINRINS